MAHASERDGSRKFIGDHLPENQCFGIDSFADSFKKGLVRHHFQGREATTIVPDSSKQIQHSNDKHMPHSSLTQVPTFACM